MKSKRLGWAVHVTPLVDLHMQKLRTNFLSKCMRKIHLKDRGVEGRIILKRILKNISPMIGSYEHDNKTSTIHKTRGIYQLSDY